MNRTVPYRNEDAFSAVDPKPPTKSANQGPFDPGADNAHWSDIAVEDDFGFGVQHSRKVS